MARYLVDQSIVLAAQTLFTRILMLFLAQFGHIDGLIIPVANNLKLPIDEFAKEDGVSFRSQTTSKNGISKVNVA